MTAILMTPEGEITLPAEVREKFGFNEWTVLSMVDMGDGSILIKPYESKLTKLTEQIQKTLEEDGVTLDDLFITLREERKRLFQERYGGLLQQKSE